mgnify:CR=1 FL=1
MIDTEKTQTQAKRALEEARKRRADEKNSTANNAIIDTNRALISGAWQGAL